jgi:ferredoxin
VIGQRKLLKWTVPGAAHAATFWGFIVLLLTIIEAYGDLFSRTFAIPGIGHWAAIGFIEDLFAVGVLAGIVTFTVIRLRNDPRKKGRTSRFAGSHTRAAWVVLAMIGAVIVTLLIYRGAQMNAGVFPYPRAWAFASWVVAQALHPLGYGVNSVLEATFILLQLGVVLAFLVVVTYSKHLHIGLAPLNIMFSRRPDALGPLEPMRSNGQVLDFEEADPDTDVFGLGKIEDMTWKGLLDLGTCTECGRCQSQCPAWATGKPLSPKQLILDLRDHAFQGALPAGQRGGPRRAPGQRPCRGRAPPGRRRGGERRHRPGCPVGVYELRRLRRGVPRRHRAHRPHQRDAPPPGPGRVRLPDRGHRHAQQPRAQGQPLGHGRRPPGRLGNRARLRGPGRRRHHPR